MSHHSSETLAACEALIRKHAPLLMMVGDYKEPKECERTGASWRYRPPLDSQTIDRIKRLYSDGTAVGGIASACGVTERTVQRHLAKARAIQ